MFDVAPTELLVLGAVALLVIPPKDLPKAMRMAGYWVGKARGVARQFRSGFDTMVREAELAEMEKKWAEENARIMREHAPDKLIDSFDPLKPLRGEAGAGGAEATAEAAAGDDAAGPVTVEQPTLFDAATGDDPARPTAQ